MEENATHNCCCGHDREEIELQEQREALIVLVDEDCDCECDEIELYTDRDPDIVLFDEYAEEYVDDIIAARVTAEEARDAVNSQSAIIIDKGNQLLRGQQTIREEQRLGIGSILSGIAAAKDYVLSSISSATNSVKNYIDSKAADILSAVQSSQFQTFTEASNDEIDDMFEGLNLPEED